MPRSSANDRSGAPESATSALFVRIPSTQARALDRIAFEARRTKQAVVSDLLERYLGDRAGDRRVTIETHEEPPTVIGRHEFRPFEAGVLTLEELAELFQVAPELIAELARSGELPGRRIGSQWRFSRAAALEWLAAGRGDAATDG